MSEFCEYKHILNAMTFDNFICDKSNEEAYNRFYSLANTSSFAGNQILLSGPKKSGKAHLINSLLDNVLKINPSLKIEKTIGVDFVGHIIFEHHSKLYGFIDDSKERYIDTLLRNDIVVIEDINYIDKQLSEGCLTKKAFCEFLDKWDFKNKLLILTIDESYEGQIIDIDVLNRLATFENIFIDKQNKDLIKNWLYNAIKLSGMTVETSIVDKIVEESDFIAYSRYLLLDYFQNNKTKALYYDETNIQINR